MPWFVGRRCLDYQVHQLSLEGGSMSTTAVVGYCLTAFGIGYAASYVLLLVRKAFQVLE